MQVYNAAGLQANVETLAEDRALDVADGMVAGEGEGRRRKSQNSYAYLETSIWPLPLKHRHLILDAGMERA